MKNTRTNNFISCPEEPLSPLLRIDKTIISSLSTITPWRSSLALAADWLMIIGAAVLCTLYFSVPLYLLTVLFIGGRFHGLAAMMHEASHYRLFHNRKLNDWVGEALCALPLLLFTLHSYRSNHFRHHQYLNTIKDPDFTRKEHDLYFDHPKNRSAIYLDLLKTITGLHFISDLITISRSKILNDIPATLKWTRRGFFLTLLISSLAFGFFDKLLLYWVVPLMTSFSLFMYLRSVSEHHGGTMVYDNVLTGSRHINANFLETICIPHNLNYHLDHHLYPSIPYYNLPTLHEELLSRPIYASNAHITDGYFKGLFRECLKDTI